MTITAILRQFIANAAADDEGYGEARLSITVDQAQQILSVLDDPMVAQAMADEAAKPKRWTR